MSVTIAIIIATIAVSMVAFPRNVQSIESMRKPELFEKLKFNAYMIYHHKEWYRMFSAGLLHANWSHLAFNMFTLFFFGRNVEQAFEAYFGKFGVGIFILFYALALGVSSIYDLLKYKDSHYYNAIGASGAVSAVLFAAILLDPNMSLFIMFIPIPIPALLFGPLYLYYSYYMGKRQMDNIGHNAHFWGAVFGFVFPVILKPVLFIYFIDGIINVFKNLFL